MCRDLERKNQDPRSVALQMWAAAGDLTRQDSYYAQFWEDVLRNKKDATPFLDKGSVCWIMDWTLISDVILHIEHLFMD